MMDSLLINTVTQKTLLKTVNSNVHAVLLSGASGSGKNTLAKEFARQKLALSTLKDLDKHPYFLIIRPENNSIGIEAIRKLQRFLQLKTTGKKTSRRGAIVTDAHLMTNEAQNALLKALEEPPEDSFIVLTAVPTLNLKPTIFSRVQKIQVLPANQEQATAFFKTKGFSDTEITKAWDISGGNAGLMASLLAEREEHELLNNIEQAKKLLKATKFERLTMVESLAKDKTQLPQLLQSLQLVCGAALGKAAEKNDSRSVSRWTNCLKIIYDSEAALISNPNTKLLLSNLMLNLI